MITDIVKILTAVVLTGVCAISSALAAGPAPDSSMGLGEAVSSSDLATVNALVDAGADPNVKGPGGVTPLMISAGQGDYNIVVRLVSAKADVRLRDDAGRTALYYAAEKGYVYVGRVLIEAGADPSARDNKGNDVASSARINGHEAMAMAVDDAIRQRAEKLLSQRQEMVRLYREGRYSDAEAAARSVLDARKDSQGSTPAELASAEDDLGAVLEAEGNYAEPESYYKSALGRRTSALGPGDPEVAGSLGRLGALYFKTGRLDEAESLFARAAKIYETAQGPGNPQTARFMKLRAETLDKAGRDDEARTLAEKAEAILKDHPATDAQSLAGIGPSVQPLPPASDEDVVTDAPFSGVRSYMGDALAVVLFVAAAFLVYRMRLVQRLLGIDFGSHVRIRDWFEARILFSKALREERAEEFYKAARLYEAVLDLNPDHDRARFQLARVYHMRLKDRPHAERHYSMLMKKLHPEHAYHRESSSALAELNGPPPR